MSDDIFNINKQWVNDWQMKINIGKCELLNIGYNNLKFLYTLDGVNITSTVSYKDLGVYVSKDFFFFQALW